MNNNYCIRKYFFILPLQGRTQLVQYRLMLHTTDPYTSSSLPVSSSPPSLYVSVIFRNVETVNWTRDSLQEAYLSRRHRQSYASCLDITSKFLNPVTQSLSTSSTNAATGGIEDSLSTHTEYYQFGDESSSDGEELTPVEEGDNRVAQLRRRSVSENNISFRI